MKIRLTESQYNLLVEQDRIEYIKGQVMVNPDEAKKWEETKDKPKRPGPDGEEPKVGKKDLEAILDDNGKPIAFLRGPKKTLKLTEETINAFVEADPSKNKQYVQWMVDVFRNIIAEGDMEHAVRFITEDLSQATDALTIFDCVKDRKKFKTIAPSRQGAPKNVKDIRQYKSVSQLYIVVSAFSCDDEDEEEGGEEGALSKKGKQLFNDIMQYKRLGQANVWKLSDRVLIYQPKTMVASCEPLGNLAQWCTRATPSGGIDPESGGAKYRDERGSEYFHSYRRKLRPGGELSEYYVIMPIELFQLPNPSSHEWYPLQFHFESGQLMHKGNARIGDQGISRVLSEYPEVGEFMRDELGRLAGQEISGGEGILDSKYLKHLNSFGGKAEDYVSKEAYEEGVESIKRLALESKGDGKSLVIKNNKYLMWLMENVSDINIVDYISQEVEDINFSDINLGDNIPDFSSFENVTDLEIRNANLSRQPTADELPKNINRLSINNNNISEFDFDGYHNLHNLTIFLGSNNPLKVINVENLKKLLEDHEVLTINLGDAQLTNHEEFVKFIEWEQENLGSVYWNYSY